MGIGLRLNGSNDGPEQRKTERPRNACGDELPAMLRAIPGKLVHLIEKSFIPSAV
jgi:hypothetical protein